MGKILGLMALSILCACAKNMEPAAEQMGQVLNSSLGCSDFKIKMWDQLYKSTSIDGSLPSREQVMEALGKELEKNLNAKEQEDLRKLKISIETFYSLLSEEAPRVFHVTGEREMTKILAGLEIGADSNPVIKNLKMRLDAHVDEIKTLSVHLKLQCQSETGSRSASPGDESVPPEDGADSSETAVVPQPTPMPNPDVPDSHLTQKTILEMLSKEVHPIALGGYEVLATTYQSCQALRQPALTRAVESISGVEVCGKLSNGGKKRCITDLNQLLRTHYYLNHYQRPHSSCVDPTRNPLIYDFGGKPDYRDGDLNLFRNQGSGGQVLGIDCSGFVFSALASQGLKIKSSVPLRAQHVLWYGASDFKNPKAQGFDCLNPATVSKTRSLKSGDIIAIETHVVLVDRVGNDPLGLKNITSVSQCNENNISAKGFDFSILQSSTSKNSIGVNRYLAKDYFDETPLIGGPMIKYAIEVCKSKFKSGETVPYTAGLSVVRHSGTAQCQDKTISLRNESCIQKCEL